jgi:hypothetical protein
MLAPCVHNRLPNFGSGTPCVPAMRTGRPRPRSNRLASFVASGFESLSVAARHACHKTWDPAHKDLQYMRRKAGQRIFNVRFANKTRAFDGHERIFPL